MPSPREIALDKNERSQFEPEPSDERPDNPLPREQDHRVNPVNPPEEPIMARNLKKG